MHFLKQYVCWPLLILQITYHLGEFARTIIRANPFKGGTSEFAYPDGGGYDSICQVLAEFILEKDGRYSNKTICQKSNY